MPEELELPEEYFYVISSYLNSSDSVVSLNRPNFIRNRFNPEGDSFFLMTVGANPYELIGSVTWGANGFDFKISFEENEEGRFETFYRIIRQNNRGGNTIAVCEEILGAGFNLSHTICLDRINGVREPRQPQGYCIKRRQNPRDKKIPTENTLSRILEMKRLNLFNNRFYNFVVQHARKIVVSLNP